MRLSWSDGYLVEYLEDEGLDVDILNEFLQKCTSKSDRDDIVGDIAAAVYDEYKAIDIEKLDKKKLKVDGADRQCKGYEIVFTEDNVFNIMDKIEDIYDAHAAEALETMDVDADEIFSELRREVRGMDDILVRVYVDKNKLAAVEMEVDGYDELVTLLFEGGDFRMQNMELTFEEGRYEYTLFELQGDRDGSEESYKFAVGENEVDGSLEYDKKSGDFSFECWSYGESAYINGNLQSSQNGVELLIDEIGADNYRINMELQVSVEKGASFEKMQGDIIDLGTLSEDDLLDIVYDMSF